jgi:general secretion pathway protein J
VKAPPSSAGARAGFTLVELLAALVIGAVVLVGIAALVRTVGLSFDRGTHNVANAERVLLAVQRLSADFASARYVLRQKDSGPALTALFTGRADGVAFVTAGHAAIGTRDDEVVFLQVEEAGDTARLVRRRTTFPGVRASFASMAPRDPVVLLEGRLVMAFAFSGDASPPKWVDRWADETEPPRRVRLMVRDRTSGADLLPPTVFAIRADAPPSCSAPEATATCIPAIAAALKPPASSTAGPGQ